MRYPGFVGARSVAGNQQQDAENEADLPPDSPGTCWFPLRHDYPASTAAG